MSKQILCSALTLLCSIIAYANAEKGNGPGNAGSQFAATFSEMAATGLDSLEATGVAKVFSGAQITLLRELIATARVEITLKRICFEGDDEKSCSPQNSLIAKNFKDKNLIKVSAAKFLNLATTQAKVMAALHEYMGLAGIENYGTPYSSQALLTPEESWRFDQKGSEGGPNAGGATAQYFTIRKKELIEVFGSPAGIDVFTIQPESAKNVCRALGLDFFQSALFKTVRRRTVLGELTISDLDGTPYFIKDTASRKTDVMQDLKCIALVPIPKLRNGAFPTPTPAAVNPLTIN